MTDAGPHHEGEAGTVTTFRLGKVVANAAAFIRRNFGLVLLVGALFFYLPVLLSELSALGDSTEIGYLLIVPIFFGQAVLSRAALGYFKGDRPSLGDCILAALRRFPSVLAIGIVVYLAMSLARRIVVMTALKLPPYGDGILLVPLFAFFLALGLCLAIVVPVLMQEKLGLFASLSHSRVLTKGHRWRIFGIIFIIVLGLVLATRASSDVLTPVEAFPVLSLIVWTLISTVLTAACVELRRVKDGPGAEELAKIFS